jgi:4-hydroxy-tetrahydrodipicolinate synthase
VHLGGVFVPLLTPMRGDGQVDVGRLPDHIERLFAAGIDGVVPLGTTGEFADLTAGERARVVEATVDGAAGRMPVVAGVGATGTTEACEHARAAADVGADAVLALPPLYWKLGPDGILRHYEAVCAATDLPVVLYDFPALSGTPLQPALVARLADAFEQVAGIKISRSELRIAHEVVARTRGRDDFAVLVGAAELVLPGLLGGIDGTFAAIANVDPATVVALVSAFREGDLHTAHDAHARVLRLLALPALASPPILALKVAAAVAGSPIEPVVRTRPDAPDEVVARAGALASDLLQHVTPAAAAPTGRDAP